MIRRLILCGPYTPEEAKAATVMAEKMVGQTIAYRSAPVERRILLFQSPGISFFSSGRRRQHARIIDDPAAQALAVVNAAVIQQKSILNVFTDLSRDGEIYAYSGTDAVFTIALPDGNAVAYFARVASGVAPGIAVQCLVFAHAKRNSPWFLSLNNWCALRDGARFSFFKRKPAGWQQGRELVVAHARRMLAEAAATYGF